jgi:lipopolysaccharide/colanic/teichoic acid biosynthesis glycosyltransferase
MIVHMLPENLRTARLVLAVSDIASAMAWLIVFAAFRAGDGAFLALAATLTFSLILGRYRVSFALRAHDEWYQAAGVALLGAALATALCVLLRFPWWSAVLSAAAWTITAGGSAAMLHRMRRRSNAFDPTCDYPQRAYDALSTKLELAAIRTLDALFAAVGLIVALPVFAIVSLAVAVDDGFPVLFRQRRKGRDDRDFVLLKLRTMRMEAGSRWVRPGDDRITRLGGVLRRTSLDELPQLYNILRGHMSMVGPRPEMSEYAERFALDMPRYSLRHTIAPGLTGWAQLHLPRNLEPGDAPRVLTYDLFYVENVCVYLYLFCMVKTACEFFKHEAM